MTVLTVIAAAISSAADAPTCGKATDTMLSVSWPAVPGCDMYYVQLSRGDGQRPFALQTTAQAPQTTLIDLVPDTAYYVSTRSHPAVDNIVWGWSPPSAATVCRTAASRTEAPHALARVGSAPSPRELTLSWTPGSGSRGAGGHDVGVRVVGAKNWTWDPVLTAGSSHTAKGLGPGHVHEVVVRDRATGAVSDPLRMRTAAEGGALYTTAFRISEYTFDVDFLENHDGANTLAMPVYVQNFGGINETAVTHANGQNYSLDVCLAALVAECPNMRGTAFGCMACADKNRAAIDLACGNYSDGDNTQGWGVHFYCGIGWPGSSFQRSPITEYCVEHTPAPQTDPIPGGDGFAQYVSCNADEVDGVLLPAGNQARKPTCICWVWDDRMLSQQPKNVTLSQCSTDVQIPWVGANQCNCSSGPGVSATFPDPDSPMVNFVGRSKVFLPYYFYKEPMQDYPVSVPVGDNLSFPRKGACTETQNLGDSGCTWKRLPTSRMLYGADLLAAGWNTTDTSAEHHGVPASHREEISHTMKNIDSFNKARDSLDLFRTPRCCGC